MTFQLFHKSSAPFAQRRRPADIEKGPHEPGGKNPSARPTWWWAVLAMVLLAAIGSAIVGVAWLKRSGVAGLSSGGGVITPIDLTAFYDKPSNSWISGNEWQEAPRGAPVLGGVPFEVNGLLRLAGRECVVKHPGDTTRTLTVTASGDGIALKTLRGQPRGAEAIPTEYTWPAEKAATIGGVVRDPGRM